MHTENYVYYDGSEKCEAFIAYDANNKQKRPGVIVVHDWSGRNSFACEKATMLAEWGYLGFACDIYGEAKVGESKEEKMALMQPFVENRGYLRQRIQAAMGALEALPFIDKDKIAIMGFCFGGLCALDLARSGAKIKASISVHGLLNKAADLDNATIVSKILALHGYEDTMVSPKQAEAFCQEMRAAGVDWQLHYYGLTQHAFTNPLADDIALGLKYNPKAEKRALKSIANFLEEVFI